MIDARHLRIVLALVVAIVPAQACANMSQLGGSGLALVIAAGVLVALTLPLFAALTAREGRRILSFFVVLTLWIALGYAAIRLPTGRDGSDGDAVIAIRLVAAGIGLLVLLFAFRIYRWWRGTRERA